jgi:hypothetical protein
LAGPANLADGRLVLAIGFLMKLRKDLYVLIAFHFLVNMWMAGRARVSGGVHFQ